MKRITPTLFATLLLLVGAGAQTLLRTHTGTANAAHTGSAIAGRGDWNGDGIQDYALGSPGFNAGAGADQGRVQVFSGSSGAQLFAANGTSAGDLFATALAVSGDVNGDGRADLVAGAPARNAGLGANQGEVTVTSGMTGGNLFTVAGTAAGDACGSAVAILGDLNADGKAEFAIGSPDFDGAAGADCGKVTVHSGADGSVLSTLEGANAGDRYGASVAGPGDTNGDAIPDLGVGIPMFDGVAGLDCGRGAVVSGSGFAEIRSVEGTLPGARLGTSVAGAGDVNNDNRTDVVFGAPLHDGAAGIATGRIVVLSGRDGAIFFAVEGANAGDQLGNSVGGGADFDADGFDDVLAGAPKFDGVPGADSGRTTAYRGPSGTVLFTIDGLSAGDEEGSAVAGLGDVNANTRADAATGAPLRDGAGTDRGQARIFGSLAATSIAEAYATATTPRAVATIDADGDGDRDLVILAGTSVSILWNGNHAGGIPPATFATLARTDVALSAGATGVSIAAGQLDADAAAEIVVGRSDGTADILDGSGAPAAVVFTLTGTSPITVDASASPGPISGVAIIGSGASASVGCAAAGTIVSSGFVARITTPVGTPAVGAALASGGAFSSIVAGDIDGDAQADLVASNSSSGASGGIHVFLGPAFSPGTGSPYATAITAGDLVLADLDATGTTNDVIVTSFSFVAGGVRVHPNYNASTGFGAAVNPGLTLARAVAAGNFDATGGEDVAILDGAGVLQRLVGWNGAAFASTTSTPTTAGAGTDVATGQLTIGAAGLCDTAEIVTVHLATDLADVWRNRRPSDLRLVASTGCPVLSPVSHATVSGEAVIGTATLAIGVSAATPLSLAILVAQPNTPVGVNPTATTISNCGIINFGATYVEFVTYTDAIGIANLPGGLPLDPCLIGLEFALQWGILDGGPLLGAITVSDGIVIRIGEN